jgi:hypothetical protein
VLVGCTTLGCKKIVVAVALVEVRSFYEIQLASVEDRLPGTNQLLCLSIVLLQSDTSERSGPTTVVPQHVHEPLLAIIIMEERRVESRGVHVNWVRPWTFNLRRGNDVVVSILERAVFAPHIGVDKPELLPIVSKTRCPNAAAVGLASHVKLGLAIERPDDKVPVRQVFRVVYLDSRIPFECGGSDVVVLSDPKDRRVGIEAREDRVSDLRHSEDS